MDKILIIAPHFPPSALPPSQRVRLLVKHFRNLGLFPLVITTFPKYREELEDPWMVELVGNDFELFEIKALHPKITRFFGIGDLGLRMMPFLLPAILRIAKRKKPSFILYPVPPWYILMITPLIRYLTKIPYGIDFIDPWMENELPSNANLKRRWSQKIARHFERKAVEASSILFSVSDGINQNLLKRYNISHRRIYSIPYGAEPSDFKTDMAGSSKENKEIMIRYTGAVWGDAYPVLDGIFRALEDISSRHSVYVEFTGTSYAGAGLVKSQLDPWIAKHHLEKVVKEYPARVSYKKALELTMKSDILLLFGGMQPYYAASKLMSLIVSGRPFIAFVHEESFPARLLLELNYKYFITYSGNEHRQPINVWMEFASKLEDLILNSVRYVSLDISHPLIRDHTASGMTKKFAESIIQMIHEQDKSLRKDQG